ncbi:MAG: phospholipase [Actinobacteria bacterium]|nr:phospholipase [Actinomycetota bacterium]
MRRGTLTAGVLLAVLLGAPACAGPEPRSYEVLREDTIINADLWSDEPKMLAAGLGFTDIIGVDDLSTDNLALSRTMTQLAGGTWNTLDCGAAAEPALSAYTSAASPDSIASLYGAEVHYADGLPIEFSWPVLPSTVDPANLSVHLNNGETVTPDVASIWPNFEYNERSVVVIFGQFGNRIPQDQPGALYPTRVEVVDSQNPLLLVGPGGNTEPATGLHADSGGSPYQDGDVPASERKGPRLAAAKLSRMNVEGDTGPRIFSSGLLPNDGVALYGDRAEYRLRVYTTGGMTPDGVRGVFPTDYERFFRITAEAADGRTIRLTEPGRDYEIDGGSVTVLGLADLGVRQDGYDDCYREDKDNYIDIILEGDEHAVRSITTVEIPGTGSYDPLYNPGGPGNDPAQGVRYSSASPPIRQRVMMAIDDPMTVTYDD